MYNEIFVWLCLIDNISFGGFNIKVYGYIENWSFSYSFLRKEFFKEISIKIIFEVFVCYIL